MVRSCIEIFEWKITPLRQKYPKQLIFEAYSLGAYDLGANSLAAYSLGLPILDPETHSPVGGLQSGGLQARATDSGSGNALTRREKI